MANPAISLKDISVGQQNCKVFGRLIRLWDAINMRSKSADPLISIDVILLDELGHAILEAELILDRDGNGGHLCSLYYLALSIILCFLILFRLSLYAGFYWYTKVKVEDDVEGSGINASVGDLRDAAVNPQPALLRATVKEEVEGQPSSSSSHVRSQFIGMGFSPMLVDRVLQKHGDRDSDTILEALLSQSALQKSGSESGSLGDLFDSDNEENSSHFAPRKEVIQDIKVEADSSSEKRSYLLSTMNFSQREVDLALNQLGEEASLEQLVDFIVTGQVSGCSGGNENGDASNECWPSWDTRKQLNSVATEVAGIEQLCERLGKMVRDSGGYLSQEKKTHIMHQCKLANLIWVGPDRLSPLDPQQVERILGYPRKHTNLFGLNPQDRIEAMRYSFQTDTLGYLLSVLKDLYPDGLRVLSIYSGIGGAAIALHRLGIPLQCVVSVDQSDTNRKILRRWWSNTEQKGQLRQINTIWKLKINVLEDLVKEFGGFDIIIGGNFSSCKGGTTVNSSMGMDSNQFFEYVRVVQRVKHIMGRLQVRAHESARHRHRSPSN
ncbi:hypothetical protein OsJ_17016 [Oryza sativa Japonica Group]|uniref:SAM-dependent MTase DRM-type domain-containing protein n=1 Tax=Oryza sativa subsp. japonica TaxID=39947 RepID=B9FMA9_ORYSJ|nr:hypothetical protein OsJ_17016 [Oryza sativa Japonica Group]